MFVKFKEKPEIISVCSVMYVVLSINFAEVDLHVP